MPFAQVWSGDEGYTRWEWSKFELGMVSRLTVKWEIRKEDDGEVLLAVPDTISWLILCRSNRLYLL